MQLGFEESITSGLSAANANIHKNKFAAAYIKDAMSIWNVYICDHKLNTAKRRPVSLAQSFTR